MKFKNKFLALLAISACMIFTLTGCSKKKETLYQDYVKGLININYIGPNSDALNDTGVSKSDAVAMYDANMEYFADNILNYYKVKVDDVSTDIRSEYVKLAKSIYNKSNYTVSPAYKRGDVYLVDVTIYPINIFAQAHDDIFTYICDYNTRVQAGEYNSYTLEQYETEFSIGLLNILDDACLNMTYSDPITLSVEIIEDGKTFYITEADFRRIDAAMISGAESLDETPEGNLENLHDNLATTEE